MVRFLRAAIMAIVGYFGLATAAEAQVRWEKQHWSCTGKGDQKRVSAQLMNIPWGQSWENTCTAQRSGPYGIKKQPDQCLNDAGIWGVWYVSSPADCGIEKVKWAGEAKSCTGGWKSTVSARLWDIPANISWENTCAATPAKGAVASRYGVSGKPDRCVKGALNEGIWGEWDIEDDAECADGRFARYPLEVVNRSESRVFATPMWLDGETLVTQDSAWIESGATRKFSIAGIDCDLDELRSRLSASPEQTTGQIVGDLATGYRDSCIGEHFQIFFWNSDADFAGYAAEQTAIALPVALLGGVLDLTTRAFTRGAVQLPFVAEATQFAVDKWRLLRDPDGKLRTWGVHGWAYNVPQQQATVYYWGRNYAQDVVLDSARVGNLPAPAQRSPRYVYELPVGDKTPELMQKRFCDQDC